MPAGRALHTFEVQVAEGQFARLVGGEPDAPERVFHESIYGPTGVALRAYLVGNIEARVVDSMNGDGYRIFADGTFAWENTSPCLQYFLFGAERRLHPMLLVQFLPDGQYIYRNLSISSTICEVLTEAGSVQRCEGFSPYSPETEFWLVDLVTLEQSAVNQTALADPGQWMPNVTTLPAQTFVLTFDEDDLNRRFSLHSRNRPEGEEQIEIFTLTTAAEELTLNDIDGVPVTVPAGIPHAILSVGTGMEMWVKRERDQSESPKVVAPYREPSATPSLLAWDLGAAFSWMTPDPVRNFQSKTFTLRASDATPGRVFTVRHADGLTIVARPNSSGVLYSYGDDARVNDSLAYVTLVADVDMNADWWLEAPGTNYPHQEVDLTNWHPTHATPPVLPPGVANASTRLMTFFGTRSGQALRVCQPDETAPGGVAWYELPLPEGTTFEDQPVLTHAGWAKVKTGGMQWTHLEAQTNGAWVYDYWVYSTYITIDETKPFWIQAGSSTSPVDQVDLRNWMLAPVPRMLTLSSTRMGHELVLVDARGVETPVVITRTQGSTTIEPHEPAWYTSEHYITATTSQQQGFSCWLEDRTTEEQSAVITGPTISASAWYNWHALPPPYQFTAIQTTAGQVKLQWETIASPSYYPSGMYSFEVKSGSGEWNNINIPARPEIKFPAKEKLIDNIPAGHALSFRLCYWMSQHGRSAWSNVATVTTPLDYDGDGLSDDDERTIYLTNPSLADTDGDGIPDNVEVAWGLSPNYRADGRLDRDGDGRSNFNEYIVGNPGYSSDEDPDEDGLTTNQELAGGTDPGHEDTDRDGVLDGQDSSPNDATKAGPIPTRHYFAVDLSALFPNADLNVDKVELDDHNKVTCWYYDYPEEEFGTTVKTWPDNTTTFVPWYHSGTNHSNTRVVMRANSEAIGIAHWTNGPILGSVQETEQPYELVVQTPGLAAPAPSWSGQLSYQYPDFFRRRQGGPGNDQPFGFNSKIVPYYVDAFHVSHMGSATTPATTYEPFSAPGDVFIGGAEDSLARNIHHAGNTLSVGTFPDTTWDARAPSGGSVIALVTNYTEQQSDLRYGGASFFSNVMPLAYQSRVTEQFAGAPFMNSKADAVVFAMMRDEDPQSESKVRKLLYVRATEPASGRRQGLYELIVPEGCWPTQMNKNGWMIAYTSGGPVLLLPGEMRITDRDDSKKKWADNVLKTVPVYAGKTTGDMVSWKLGGTDSWTNTTFTWSAEGPEARTGPTGPGKNEWKIADGDADTDHDWIDWKPGKYKIKCQISSAGGSSSTAEFEQEVGVRTDDVLVVGWIDPQQVPLSGAGVQSALTQVFPLGGLSSSDSANAKAKAAQLLGIMSTQGVNFTFEIGPGSDPSSFTPFSSTDKTYALNWMFRYGGNRPPEASFQDGDGYFSQALLDQFASEEDKTRYKLINHFQVKFLTSDDAKFKSGSLKLLKNRVYTGNTRDPSRYYEVLGWIADLGRWVNNEWRLISDGLG